MACPSCNRYKTTRQTAIDPNIQDEVKLFTAVTAIVRYVLSPERVQELAGRGETVFHNSRKRCNPQQQLWADHFIWSEDATEIVGLTTIGRATISTLKMNRLQLIRVRKMWGKMGKHPPQI